MAKPKPRTTCVVQTEATAPNVVVVDIQPRDGEDACWFLLQSDVHWDNPHCDRAMHTRHLKESQARGAGIIDAGDFFCAMQGKFDKRSSKSSIREEHLCGDYLDALTRTAIDYWRPYADNLLVMGHGNHETSIRNRHEVDLTERLVSGLSTQTHRVHKGGYSGWIVFRYKQDHGRSDTLTLWYIHGYGGGGPVTVDNIQAQRQMGYVDADILVSGHTHDSWVRDFSRIGLNKMYKPNQRLCEYAKLGTYKDEYADGAGGWHIETGKPPKTLAGKWLKLTFERSRIGGGERRGIVWEFQNAR
jgi:hypothetical protein